MPVHKIAATATLLVLLFTPVALAANVEDTLHHERIAAEKLFADLLAAAEIKTSVYLNIIPESPSMLLFGKSDGGCYENMIVVGIIKDMLQTPVVSITMAVLWADRGKSDLPLTAYVLAHEISHTQKTLAKKWLCREEKQHFAKHSKEEELWADENAVRLLKKVGLDGATLAEAGIRAACTTNPDLCPRESDTHPTLKERVNAIRRAGEEKSREELEKILKDISFPLFFQPDKPYVGTGFNLLPSRNHLLTIAAGAGHVWEYLYQLYTRKQNEDRKETTTELCGSGRGCSKFKHRESHWFWKDLIAVGTQDPIDYLLYWRPSDGSLKTHYAPVSPENLREGELYYSLGATENDERGLAVLEYKGKSSGYLGFHFLDGYFMREGTSGSPILNKYGELVGISVRSSEKEKSVKATDIRKIIRLAEAVRDYIPEFIIE